MGAKQPITIWLTNHYIISFWVVNLLLPNGSHNRLFEFDKNVAIFPLGQEGFFEINTLKCGGKKIKKLFKISNVFEIDENFEIDDDNDDENDDNADIANTWIEWHLYSWSSGPAKTGL
jgi:hypothetical protein